MPNADIERWLTQCKAFIKQPGNTHLLLAGALLIALALVVTLAGRTVDPVPESALTEIPDSQQADTVIAETAFPPTESWTETSPDTAAHTEALAGQESDVDDSDLTDPDIVDAIALSDLPRLVLILDDIGYNAEAGLRAIALPGAVTYAVLPYTPHGQNLAIKAHEANKEVMLHAPMSNVSGMALGQGGLTLELSEEEFLDTLRGALADIPHIKGINNHTGSELTAVQQPMNWVMQELKERDLFFVDSLTTSASVAEATAIAWQVPSLRRHVFLDNTATEEAIDIEFQRALAIARQQGYAVAIGHPYPETLSYLEQVLPTLDDAGIELVSASTLIRLKQNSVR